MKFFELKFHILNWVNKVNYDFLPNAVIIGLTCVLGIIKGNKHKYLKSDHRYNVGV